MDKKEILLTQEGLQDLIDEKEHLMSVERPNVLEEIAYARSQGDLSENADYAAAREKQAEIEARIREIDGMLPYVKIIGDSGSREFVEAGSKVVILDLSDPDNEEETYRIVGTTETDPFSGKISNDSPLAKAIINHKIGDVVTVGVAEPYDVKIVDIIVSENVN